MTSAAPQDELPVTAAWQTRLAWNSPLVTRWVGTCTSSLPP